MAATPRELFERRRKRTRSKLRKHNQTQPRLSVFRSSKHMYAQIIDDLEGRTLASASTLEKDVLSKIKNGGDKKAAGEIGKLIAERAKAAGVESVMFDRGGYLFHGRVKSLADAAREAGLSF